MPDHISYSDLSCRHAGEAATLRDFLHSPWRGRIAFRRHATQIPPVAIVTEWVTAYRAVQSNSWSGMDTTLGLGHWRRGAVCLHREFSAQEQPPLITMIGSGCWKGVFNSGAS